MREEIRLSMITISIQHIGNNCLYSQSLDMSWSVGDASYFTQLSRPDPGIAPIVGAGQKIKRRK